MASSSTTNPPTTTKFTPEMQDRQARNKDPYTGKVPYNSASDEEGGGSSSSSVTPQPRKTPKYAFLPLVARVNHRVKHNLTTPFPKIHLRRR